MGKKVIIGMIMVAVFTGVLQPETLQDSKDKVAGEKSVKEEISPEREKVILLAEAVKKNPDNHQLKVQLGLAYYNDNMYKEAIGCFKAAEKEGVKNYFLYYNLGNAYYWNNMFTEAADSFNKALSFIRNEYQARCMLSIAEAQSILVNDNNNIPMMLKLARGYYDFGWFSSSQSKCRDILKLNQENPEAMRLLEDLNTAVKADSLNNEGIEFYKKSQYEEALHCYEKGLELLKGSGNRFMLSMMIGNSAIIYQIKCENDKAMKCYNEQLLLTKELGDRQGEFSALNGLGIIYSDKGDYDKALQFLGRSLEIAVETGNRSGEGISLGNIGIIYQDKSEYDKALEYHKKSLETAIETGNRNGEASSLGNIGLIYSDKGEYDKALDFYNKQLIIERETGYRIGESITIGNIGLAYKNKGEYNKALKYYNEQLKICRETGYRKGEAISTGNIGGVYYDTGDFQKYITLTNSAIEIAEKIDYNYGIVVWKESQGLYYLEVHEFEKSEVKLKEALELSLKLGIRQRIAECHWVFAKLYLKKKEYKDAEEYSEKAVRLYTDTGLKPDIVKSLILNAEILSYLGRHDIALKRIREAESMEANIGRKPMLAEIYMIAGEILIRGKDFSSAGGSFEKSSTVSGEFGDKNTLWRIYRGFAAVAEQKGELQNAVDNYKKSIDIIKSIHISLGDLEKKGYMQDKLGVYENLVALLIKLNRTDEAIKYLNESKQFIINTSDTGSGAKLGKESREKFLRWQKLEKEISSLSEKLSKAKDADSIANLQKSLSEVRKQSRELLLFMQSDPSYGKVTYKTQKAINENQKKIPKDTVVLEYALSESGSYVIVIGTDEFSVVKIPLTTSEIVELSQEFIRWLRQVSDDDNAGKKLYSVLIKPVEQKIEKYSVVAIVAHGILNYIPFEALQREGEKGPKYFIEDKIIAYLPDGSLEPILDKNPIPGDKNVFIGFGNATFDTRPLPGAEDEVKDIQKILPGKLGTGFLRDKANKENFRLNAPGYYIVHIATHAILEKMDVMSYLQFYHGEEGRLTLRELCVDYPDFFTGNTKIAVLSACETATSKNLSDPTGGEVLSLASAFLANRITVVIASVWSVDDASTREFMVSFYRNLLQDRKTVGNSLRSAKIGMIKSRYNHPYYWAPFVLYGDWR